MVLTVKGDPIQGVDGGGKDVLVERPAHTLDVLSAAGATMRG